MIDTAETAAFIALPLIVALAVAALFSAHIPWLRRVTGAAPLEKETTDDRTESDHAAVRRPAAAALAFTDAACATASAVQAMAIGRRLQLPEGGEGRAEEA